MSSSDRHPVSLQPATSSREDPGLSSRLKLYRRWLPVPISLVLLVIFQPKLSGNPSVDTLISAVGFLLCASGQSLRLWAWGSNAQTGNSGVRDRGAYALMRHPLYAGNFLIAAGLAVTYNNPVAYLFLVAPFAVIYNVIVRTEEQYMTEAFPSDYQRYLARSLSRFLPAFNNLGSAVRTTFPFGWGFAWRKEYPSFCAWVAGLAGLELYKEVPAHGWTPSWSSNVLWVAIMSICATAMLLSNAHHRQRRKANAKK